MSLSIGVRKIRKSFLFYLFGALISLALLSIFFLDQSIVLAVSTKRHPSFYRIVRFLTDLGEGKYYFGFVILAGFVSWVAHLYFKKIKKATNPFAESLAKWSLYAFSCMLGSGAVLQILKHLFGRQRPHVIAEVDPHAFNFLTTNWHYHSMPSGHSQTVFTFATLLWITFPKFGKWFFVLAAILAFTRIPLEEHFPSDLIMGGVVGFFMTILISVRWGKVALTDS